MGKETPVRTCVVCRQGKSKEELLRVIKTPEGEIKLDIRGKSNGRGAYICRNAACISAARKKRGLEKSLKTAIPESLYEELEKVIKDE